MSFIFTLLRNVIVSTLAILRNFFWLLGLRPSRPDWVSFDLRGEPTYRPLPRRLRLMASFTSRYIPTDLHTLSRQLDLVARVPKVRGVVLRVDGLSTSLAKIGTIANMLAALRKANKRVLIWTPHSSSRDASLIFSGDRLFVAPAGRLELQGFAIQTTFAAPALEWLGLGVTIVRRGRYKTAGETLVNEKMSPELRETLDGILDDLFHMTKSALANGRGMDLDQVEKLLDEAPWTGEQATIAGVADGALYFDELVEMLEAGTLEPPLGQSALDKESLGQAKYQTQESLSEPAARDMDEQRRKPAKTKTKVASWPIFRASQPSSLGWRSTRASRRTIAVLPLRGLIVEGESRQFLGGSVFGHRNVTEALEKIRKDSSIGAVVLHIESRGGSALASDLIWREVQRTVKKKPVVAYIDTVAASGGYYCAAATSHIVANPLSITGSIGVISILLETSRLSSSIKLRRELLQRGRRAAIGSSMRPPTSDELASLEADVDAFYEIFLDRVSKGRSMTREEVEACAEGRVFTGRRAAELGLLDELRDFEAAVEKARTLAGLPEKTPLSTIDPDGSAFGSPAQMSMSGTRQSFVTDMLESNLGLDGFDLAWLEAVAAFPRTSWAVMPERLV